MYVAIGNIHDFFEDLYNVSLDSNFDYGVGYNYGFPHPLFSANTFKKLITIEPNSELQRPKEEWTDFENTTLEYEFPEGMVYIEVEEDYISFNLFQGEKLSNLLDRINEQLFNHIKNEIESRDIKIENPHSHVFEDSVLYLAFLQYPNKSIKLWNTFAEDIFAQNILGEPSRGQARHK
jgi:hypothetical protein